jgi:hypothetical protein
MAALEPHDIDKTFAAPIKDNMGPNSWTCAILPDSAEYFGTARAVKVSGTIDGHAFTGNVLPEGGGKHMLPLNAAMRKLVNKPAGTEVTVHLTRRLG